MQRIRTIGVWVLFVASACFAGGEDAGGAAERTSDSAFTAGGSAGTGAGADTFGNQVGSSAGTGAAGTGGGFAGTGGTGGVGGSGSAGTGANTNVSLSGSQDFGYFRSQIAAGVVPAVGTFDAAGFFAEHHTALPEPTCGQRICLQAMLGVLGNLINGENCTMLQLGLNSPLAADPATRPDLNLVVVVDTSGSMNDAGKIEFVRQGLGLLIDGMSDADRLALVTYADTAQVVQPLLDVGGNRVALREIVGALVANGSTNLFDGLRIGYEQAQTHYDSGRQNRVILLSDGNPTAGITDLASILAMSAENNAGGIGLSTVGLGVDFNVDLMRGLAEQGDGNYYFVENSGAVNEVFTEELSYFIVPVAFDLRLELVSGTHYTLRRTFGTSFWNDTPQGGVLEVPSVFLAHRESDADVTADGGRRGGGSALMIELMPTVTAASGLGLTETTVAVIDVAFREPGTNATLTDRIEVRFPHAPWVTPARGEWVSSDIPIIQKSFVMLNVYTALEMAAEAYHAGALQMAVDGLDRVIDAVEDYNQEIGDVDIQYDLELMRDMRALIHSQVPAPQPPPPPVSDPWPCD